MANRKQVTSLGITRAEDVVNKIVTDLLVNPTIFGTDEKTGLANWQAEMGATLWMDDGISLPDAKGRAITVQVGNS